MQEEIKCDIVVVGGGPAGSLTAYYTSKLGFKTILLEKYKFPREKPCAGGLTMRALKYIPFSIDELVQKKEYELNIFNKNKDKHTLFSEHLFCTQIIRSEFDDFLLKQSIKAGTIVKHEQKVKQIIKHNDYIEVISTGNKIFTKYLCAADGSNSTIRKLLKINISGKNGFAIEGDIDNKLLSAFNLKMEFNFNYSDSNYAWTFRKNSHINVGVYSCNSSKTKLRKKNLFEYVKNKYQIESNNIKNIRGFPINFDYHNINLSNNRIIFIGDAAGFAEPLLGEGIHHALKSAYLAGKAFKEIKLNGKLNLQNTYTLKCKKIIQDLRFCNFLANNFYRTRNDIGFMILKQYLIKQAFLKMMIAGRPTVDLIKKAPLVPFWSKCKQNSVKF